MSKIAPSLHASVPLPYFCKSICTASVFWVSCSKLWSRYSLSSFHALESPHHSVDCKQIGNVQWFVFIVVFVLELHNITSYLHMRDVRCNETHWFGLKTVSKMLPKNTVASRQLWTHCSLQNWLANFAKKLSHERCHSSSHQLLSNAAAAAIACLWQFYSHKYCHMNRRWTRNVSAALRARGLTYCVALRAHVRLSGAVFGCAFFHIVEWIHCVAWHFCDRQIRFRWEHNYGYWD